MLASQITDFSQMDVPFIASLVGVGSDPGNVAVGFNALMVVTVVLALIVFKLGFAKQLKWWKSLVVYVLLSMGAATMALAFWVWPIPEVLFVMAVVLAIYRGRLWWNRRNGAPAH